MFFFIISYIFWNKHVLILLLKVIKPFLFGGEWVGLGRTFPYLKCKYSREKGMVKIWEEWPVKAGEGGSPQGDWERRPGVGQDAKWEGCKILRVKLKTSFIYLMAYPRPVFTSFLTEVCSFLTLAHVAWGRGLCKILCLRRGRKVGSRVWKESGHRLCSEREGKEPGITVRWLGLAHIRQFVSTEIFLIYLKTDTQRFTDHAGILEECFHGHCLFVIVKVDLFQLTHV